MCNLSEAVEEIGIAKGIEHNLITLICKKIQKNKSIQQIADELEEQVEEIQPYYEAVLAEAPEYDVEKIYARVKNMAPIMLKSI